MPDRTPLAEVINTFSVITAMIVHDLEGLGVLRDFDFAKHLRDAAEDAEKNAPEHLKDRPRLDLQIFRHVASLIERHREGSPLKSWTPVVIDGGIEGQLPEGD
jgi:hypothetical protein